MKNFLIVIILCLLLCGCSGNSNKVNYEKIMSENEYVIVDVRTKEEYEEGHIVDAINIPYDEIDNNTFDKEEVIFVYCRSGNRSKIAYDYLVSLGYKVYDLGAYDKIDLPNE